MKKLLITTAICISTLAISTNISASQASAYTPPDISYSITVNGNDIGEFSKTVNKSIAVPLRSVSEALGYTVVWNSESSSIHIENGIRESNILIGSTKYSAYNTDIPSMTSPSDLGMPASIIDGSTYVPVEFYRILLGNSYDCVVIGEKNISINEKNNIGVSLINPFTEYNSTDDAREAIGFYFPTPQTLPDGYKQYSLSVMNSGNISMAQINYDNDTSKITYRVSKSMDDITGDYNTYEKVSDIEIENLTVSIRQNGDLIFSATWKTEDLNYSLRFDSGISPEELETVVLSIK